MRMIPLPLTTQPADATLSSATPLSPTKADFDSHTAEGSAMDGSMMDTKRMDTKITTGTRTGGKASLGAAADTTSKTRSHLLKMIIKNEQQRHGNEKTQP